MWIYISMCVRVCGAKAPQLELKRVKGTRAANNQSNSHTHTS